MRLRAEMFAIATCEEVTGSIGFARIRCGAPAVMLIQHQGRAEGPYFMCIACGTHNVERRDAEILARVDQ